MPCLSAYRNYTALHKQQLFQVVSVLMNSRSSRLVGGLNKGVLYRSGHGLVVGSRNRLQTAYSPGLC